ncbi:MAG: hypothetical protein K6L75_05155 [Cellvibrionaceae bacterium]
MASSFPLTAIPCAVFFVVMNAASQQKSNHKNGFPLAGIPPFLQFPLVAVAPCGAFFYVCPRAAILTRKQQKESHHGHY